MVLQDPYIVEDEEMTDSGEVEELSVEPMGLRKFM